MIGLDIFESVEMRVGTIIDAKPNKKARDPAYKLKIDFGEFGVKKSSAQLTQLYTPEDLIGRQVICVMNFHPIHIGDVTSEVRVLGTDSPQGVVLLRPDEGVTNGDKIY